MGKLILSGCDKHLCRLRNIFILVVKATTLRWKRKGIIEVCHFNNDARVYFLIKSSYEHRFAVQLSLILLLLSTTGVFDVCLMFRAQIQHCGT